ncbi:MAG: hypothetical protein E7366_00935 [Clostridiales bacterium]|nr:hypothetical protein [Clostridiales bacterium]
MTWLRERILIEGIMPERALLRLKRANIDVYNVKKVQKNQILLSVNKKDSKKVFAIYPNVCYNISVYTPYVTKHVGYEGMAKYLETAKNRVGLLLGGLLFLGSTLFFNGFVFGVDFIGSDVYKREVYMALEEGGIAPFHPYTTGNEDWICSQILRLDRVEFCSIKKEGLRTKVEIRLSPFSTSTLQKGDMIVKHTGEIIALTVLRGSALKKIGDTVTAGESLVGGYFSTETGEQVRVEPIARARIACTYEEKIEAENKTQAFAIAYLNAELGAEDCVKQTIVESTEQETIFYVKIEYETIETVNF